MTKLELLQIYANLDSWAKARFLAVLSHQLTIRMRESYDESIASDQRIKLLMGANELQHHLSSELRHHLEEDTNRYPDEVLMNILLEKAQYYQLSNELQGSLIHTANKFGDSARTSTVLS
ncbi:hypothetical protein GCM10011507_05590 [Edaphobacter acidisoli]|uniref:Uncharacterized protein n=1 Tax=Edaphobacter acidisoli TaxID=2040573 RepID=A0A916RIF6_9BACT|nr:hypothetical protein [Edaphobacter acidisoli]GGA57141.1 hypothetical protein GCM10011507_05590 [Edaphobacter acidisoli]